MVGGGDGPPRWWRGDLGQAGPCGPQTHIPWPLKVRDLREPELCTSHLGNFRQGQRERSRAQVRQIQVLIWLSSSLALQLLSESLEVSRP